MTDPIGIFAACLLRAAAKYQWRKARSVASASAASFPEFAAIGKAERKAVRQAAITMIIRAGFIAPTGYKNAYELTALGKVAAATIKTGMENHIKAKRKEWRNAAP